MIMGKEAKDSSLTGFTLIELLIVIGIIAVLATVVLVGINPARQFALARNTGRANAVKVLVDMFHQRAAINQGKLGGRFLAKINIGGKEEAFPFICPTPVLASGVASLPAGSIPMVYGVEYTIASSSTTLATALPSSTAGTGSVTITVPTAPAGANNSTYSFPVPGVLLIDNELMLYTGVTSNTFTGVTRGYTLASGTVVPQHSVGALISLYSRATTLPSLGPAPTEISATLATIPVVSTTGFPTPPAGSSATILIDDELITYTGLGTTTATIGGVSTSVPAFTGAVRGAFGTTATTHAANAAVVFATNSLTPPAGSIGTAGVKLITDVSTGTISYIEGPKIDLACFMTFTASGKLPIEDNPITTTSVTTPSYTGRQLNPGWNGNYDYQTLYNVRANSDGTFETFSPGTELPGEVPEINAKR